MKKCKEHKHSPASHPGSSHAKHHEHSIKHGNGMRKIKRKE